MTKTISFILFTLTLLFFASASASASASDSDRKLYIYNWSDYMDPTIIKAFEKEYHVKVIRSFYDNNSTLFAKLRSGGANQYDVIVPSGFYVPRLIHAGLLQPLKHSLIPNLNNLMPKFRNPDYDPHSKYTAAYQWGDNGIIYNAKKLPDAPESWAIIFDPKFNTKYPFALDYGSQGAIADACAYLGLGYNCIGQKKWEKAAKLVIKTKKRNNFVGFIRSTPVIAQLIRGTVAAAVTNNGDYAFDKKRNPKEFTNLKFILPKEGSELWVDTMAIPVHAPHPWLANKFINFILRAKIGAKLSNWNSYTSPNEASQSMLDKELSNPPIQPTQAQMKQLHYLPRVKGRQLQILNELWQQIQSF